VAARVTLHTDRVDVAGIVFELSCPFPKPGFWARRQPAFISRRRPDVTVRIDYEERLERRPWRSIGDVVADAPSVRRRGRRLVASTGYYRASVDVSRGRAAVRIAAGFDVAALMRTLAALWLAERATLLLRAACFESAGAATLACGLPVSVLVPSASVGWFAVTPGDDGVLVRSTPFLDRPGSLRMRGRRVTALWLPGSREGQPPGPAEALRALLPSIWPADRRRAAVESTLDLATRVVTALPCRGIGATDRIRDEAAVG
jgi:hypothetical protein